MIHKSQTRTLRLFFLNVSSYIDQAFLLATDLLLDTQSPGLCVQFYKDTAYKSTSQSDTKSLPQSQRLKGLELACRGGIAAFSKLKLSSHRVFSGFAFNSLSFCNLFFHGADGMLLQTCGS